MPPQTFNPYICMEFDSFLFSSVGTDRDKVDAKGSKLTNNNTYAASCTPYSAHMYICIRMHNILYTDKIMIILHIDRDFPQS